MSYVDKVQWLYLVVAGGIIHLVMDWFAQNHWQATNKMKRYERPQLMRVTSKTGDEPEQVEYIDLPPLRGKWWQRHEAAYAHAGLHFLPLLLIFPVWAAFLIALLHLIIDTRSPLDWWGKFTKQTRHHSRSLVIKHTDGTQERVPLPDDLVDIGTEVGFWRDQTAHIVVIALVALLCVS